MKKPFHFTEKSSDVKCGNCKKPLKANLVSRKRNPRLCYGCYCYAEALNNHAIKDYKKHVHKAR